MTLLSNALLLHLAPPRVEPACLRFEQGRITAVAPRLDPLPGEDVVDVEGRPVLAGLVNGHTHLYSALATGMPGPRHPARDFLGILVEVWWWLDRHLDAGTIAASGLAGALDAIRCGTTGFIDHHASPAAIDESLDVLSAAIAHVGQRASLCYEATDRHGEPDGLRGVRESARFAAACGGGASGATGAAGGAKAGGPRSRAGLIGLHASLTCGDATLAAARDAADAAGCALHVHVAEDGCDRAVTWDRYRRRLVDALLGEGIARPGTIIAHGVHLDRDEIERLAAAGCWFAHQSRSNQNNAVGHAPLHRFPAERLLLGTDGIGADMFAEAQAAYFRSRDGRTGLTPETTIGALANNAACLGDMLGEPLLGRLEVGAPADVVVLDTDPTTPISDGSLAWHLIFQVGSRHVADVFIGGERVLRGGRVVRPIEGGDERAARARLRDEARRLWAAMQAE